VPRLSESTLAAIKNAVDIVTIVGESLGPLVRSGSKFKALCPFHDDHRPSLEVNPARQSFKCWSCGAGGDVFDFVKEYERVDFPEAMRMLAERAGVVLDAPSAKATAEQGPSKTELLAVHSWAESVYIEALAGSEPARQYLDARGISQASAGLFRLGFAPEERGWLLARARRGGFPVDLLERTGLASRAEEEPGQLRERFRGRLIFPIHDPKGRPIGFGGRVLPEVERFLAASGKNVAKYLNSPETPLFQKRRVLYAWDLARSAARDAGWVAVVEGYTDVIAAHQVGLRNVVGTLGTALGDDHVTALRRLADQVVLVFDGDTAGQTAADRALELFLGHEVDVRVLSLPENLDPCDFLLNEGAAAFRTLVERAVDPLTFVLKRAEERFDFRSIEGSRLASESVLAVLARVPTFNRVGLDVKVAKALDTLSERLRVPVSTLERGLRKLQRAARPPRAGRALASAPAAAAGTRPVPGNGASTSIDSDGVRESRGSQESRGGEPGSDAAALNERVPILPSALDPTDRELIQIVLSEPAAVGKVIARVAVTSLVDAPLRAILQACYGLHGEGQPATFERVALRIDDATVRALAASLLLPLDPVRLPEKPSGGPADSVRPAAWEVLLTQILVRLAERDRLARLRELQAALHETNELDDPVAYRALQTEYRRLMFQRPDTKKTSAS
jgi:DNA primase